MEDEVTCGHTKRRGGDGLARIEIAINQAERFGQSDTTTVGLHTQRN